MVCKRKFYSIWCIQFLDLVRYVICTLVSRIHMPFHILTEGYTFPGNQGTHDKLNQIPFLNCKLLDKKLSYKSKSYKMSMPFYYLVIIIVAMPLSNIFHMDSLVLCTWSNFATIFVILTFLFYPDLTSWGQMFWKYHHKTILKLT